SPVGFYRGPRGAGSGAAGSGLDGGSSPPEIRWRCRWAGYAADGLHALSGRWGRQRSAEGVASVRPVLACAVEDFAVGAYRIMRALGFGPALTRADEKEVKPLTPEAAAKKVGELVTVQMEVKFAASGRGDRA